MDNFLDIVISIWNEGVFGINFNNIVIFTNNIGSSLLSTRSKNFQNGYFKSFKI